MRAPLVLLLLCSCAYVRVTEDGVTAIAIGQAKAEYCSTGPQPPALELPEAECVTITGGPISAALAGALGAIGGALLP